MYCNAFTDFQYLIFTSGVPSLLYYSHIPVAFISLLLGIFVFTQNRQALLNKILFGISVLFSLWIVADMVVWLSPNSQVVMFFWSLFGIIFALISALCVYFVYVFVKGQDISISQKIFLSITLLPIILLTPTVYNLSGFDISICGANESIFVIYYKFLYGVCIFLWILGIGIFNYRKIAKESRRKVILLIAGVEAFLLSFFTATFITSYLTAQGLISDFGLEQYGLFGMVIFMAFLTFIIVRYKAFNIKLIGAQALIVSLVVLIGSEFFFIQSTTNQILTAITLIITGVIGLNLIRSVKKEVAQREHIELLAQGLEVANRGQENLIHVMNHQIKGYLGTARNIFAELLGTDYGQMPEASMPLLTKGLEEMGAGVEYVQQILKGASAHSGTLPYDMRSIDIKSLVTNLVSKQKEVAEKAGLMFESHITDGDYAMTGDATMLEEAFKNLITNAIKYNNPNGSIAITLSRTDGKILFGVKDTGRGISKEDEPKLFKPGGVGKDSIKFNVESSGFGLAFVKPVVEKHGGRVWYVSNSPEKGTTFFVELPVS